MNKSIKDCTLEDIKRYCLERESNNLSCEGCRFGNLCHKYFNNRPSNFSDKILSAWNFVDVENAKAIKTLFPCVKFFKRENEEIYCLTDEKRIIHIFDIYSIPSLKKGQMVSLKEIIGDYD